MSDSFKAIVIEDVEDRPQARFKTLTLDDLPDLDVLVEIAFSSLNYKDGLAVSGKQKIARKPSMIAGIDLAGTVVESRSDAWKPGDRVIVNGWGMSETQQGGYSKYQRVRAEWLVRLPDAFTPEQAMAIGTAGYTAALCVDALTDYGVTDGELLVTGAAGGVGSVAVALASKAGFAVTAATGRPDTHDYLRELGATGFLERQELAEKGAPLQKERWAGGIDAVGSVPLANALAQTRYGGAVAACGLAGGADLPGTVLPHILRGVALLGVDSVMAPPARRERAWSRLARDLDPAQLAHMTTVEPMSNLPVLAQRILAGQIRGRVVIDVAR